MYVVYTRSCTPVPASRLGPSRTITRTWTLTNTPTILLAFACELSLSLSVTVSPECPRNPWLPSSRVECRWTKKRGRWTAKKLKRERERVGIENVLRGLVGEKSRFNPNSPEKSCDST